MSVHNFKFELGQQVIIMQSGECGRIIGQCTYLHQGEDCFWVEYADAKGSFTNVWWGEHLLASQV